MGLTRNGCDNHLENVDVVCCVENFAPFLLQRLVSECKGYDKRSISSSENYFLLPFFDGYFLSTELHTFGLGSLLSGRHFLTNIFCQLNQRARTVVYP